MRVLLVEDDRMIAQGLLTALRQDGHAVDWMQDGASADEALRASTFDLVLLDLGLPRRDGLTVLRELRAAGTTPRPSSSSPRATTCRIALPVSMPAPMTTW